MQNGWIKLHRKLLDNPIHLRGEWFSVWVHLLLLASHDEHSFIWNGKNEVIKSGQLLTGRKELAKQCGVTPSLVERVLKYLEIEHQIEQQKTTKYRVITIVNWNKYQNTDIKSDNKRTTNGQQTDTYKNNNKEKNDKNNTGNEEKSQTNKEIAEVIASFSAINPSFAKWYGNITQRSAVERMLKIHGKDKLLNVISLLPKSNTMPYVPTITSPYVLEEKWADLEASLMKFKNKSIISQPKVIM